MKSALDGIHPEELGLLQAIVREPDDDSLRLMLADWLEDHGSPRRADYVRASVEEAAHPCASLKKGHAHLDVPPCVINPYGGATGKALAAERVYTRISHCCLSLMDIRKRRHEAESMPLAEWGQHCRLLVNSGHPAWEWSMSRGLPSHIDCRLGEWLSWGPALVRLHPLAEVRVLAKAPMARAGGYWPASEDGVADWYNFGCRPVGTEEEADDIPMAVFQFLEGRKFYKWVGGYRACGGKQGDTLWKLFDSEKEAQDALSRACLAWAKAQPL